MAATGGLILSENINQKTIQANADDSSIVYLYLFNPKLNLSLTNNVRIGPFFCSRWVQLAFAVAQCCTVCYNNTHMSFSKILVLHGCCVSWGL